MDEGLNFYQALSETGRAFDGEVYRAKFMPLFLKKGLNALEQKFYESKKAEINSDLKVNLKSSPFSIPNALVLCYVGLVYYLLSGQDELQDIWFMYAWVLPSLLTMSYIRMALKGNINSASGLGWLFASKKKRVRSVYINLVLHATGNGWLGWLNLLFVPLHYIHRYGYLSDEICLYTMLSLIAITLFAQVQVIKLIPRVNKLINS